jgi:hypothetical protein
MSCERGSPTPHRQAKTIVQARCELCDVERVHPPCGDFDRERNPVEVAAELRNKRSVRIGQFEGVLSGDGSLNEQLHRRKGERLRRSQLLGYGRRR